MKLFVYGTLTDMQAFGRCAGKPMISHGEPATLRGFTRVYLRGARYPTLKRAPGAFVHGVVVRINADMLWRLQNYESVRYRLVHLPLRCKARWQRARVFIGDAPTRVAWVPEPKIMNLRSRSF